MGSCPRSPARSPALVCSKVNENANTFVFVPTWRESAANVQHSNVRSTHEFCQSDSYELANWAAGYAGYLHELMILRLFKHFSSRVFTIYGIEWDFYGISKTTM